MLEEEYEDKKAFENNFKEVEKESEYEDAEIQKEKQEDEEDLSDYE